MNTMNGILSRSEMKSIIAGNCPSCADCATDCLNLYSGYHTECDIMYPDPSSDNNALCHEETHNMNNQCINDCFQVN